MTTVQKEKHLRYMVALWSFIQCGKKRRVSLKDIENHFGRYCEHIMLELVLYGYFNSSSEGWYPTEQYRGMNASDFQAALKKHYNAYGQ